MSLSETGPYPQSSISIRGQPTLSLSTSGYELEVALRYESDTTGRDRRLAFHANSGILRSDAPNNGYCSLYTHPDCELNSRVPWMQPNVSMRRPRDTSGRFLDHFEVKSLDGWAEVGPGESFTKVVNLQWGDRSGWQGLLEPGRDYWIRFDQASAMGVARGHFGLPSYWKYGTLQELRAKLPWREAYDVTEVAKPFEPSNTQEVRVVE